MFGYLKLLAIITLAVVLAGIAFAGSFFSAQIEQKMVRPMLEQQARNYANSYINQIWKKHSSNLSILNRMAKDKREAHKAFQLWQEHTKGFLVNTEFTQFSVYNNIGENIFSAVEGSSFPVNNQLVQEAANGRSLVEITGAISYNGESGKFLRVLLPIQLRSSVEGVVEIDYSLSLVAGEIGLIKMLLWIVVGGAVIFLAIAILIVSKKAEALIAKLHDNNVELTSLKERAESESREKSKFLANVSHELRTPLNAIIGFSDIMKNETMGPLENDQYKDYIRDINSSGVHLLSLINDILDYSKAEAGKLEVESVSVDITKILKNSLRLVLPRAEEAKVKLIDETPKKHIVISTDPKRFKQVILNFLSNSVKFTPEGGEVKLIAIENPDNTLTVRIQDNGIGISHKNIAKAMSTFGQVDSSLSRRYEGTGLGLPFSKKLVEMMGGDFDIQSEEGLGTTITLTFKMPEIEEGSAEIGVSDKASLSHVTAPQPLSAPLPQQQMAAPMDGQTLQPPQAQQQFNGGDSGLQLARLGTDLDSAAESRPARPPQQTADQAAPQMSNPDIPPASSN